MVDEKTQEIDLKGNSNISFFLIHGYTGSTKDFNDLPAYLNKKYDADVRLIKLKGHEETIEKLDCLEYEDFFQQAKKELEKEILKGKRIFIGGISFGALLAITLSNYFDIEGVFLASTPYKLKFPFNFNAIKILGKFKKYWPKRLTKEERSIRKGLHYRYMHKKGLDIIQKAIEDLKISTSKRIKKPALFIHTKSDPIGSINGVKELISKYFENGKILTFNSKTHNVFFSRFHTEVYKHITDFFDKEIFKEEEKKKVAAIIPAYNEAERIAGVLESLSDSKLIDEIIVVDDGSFDKTGEIVSKFKNVKYIKNTKNLGKSASMQKGVNSTEAQIIFFCDADLINFKGKYADKIISPVLSGEKDMFIGLRKNFMQRAVKKWAINSGERAISRTLWNKIPKYYKHRYRIEAGLNNFISHFGRGFGYSELDYSQPVKEKKYGFFKGFVLRWWMNLDVTLSVIRFHFYDRFRNFSFY